MTICVRTPGLRAADGRLMKGKWRIVEMRRYETDFPDTAEPAYILLDGQIDCEFAFGAPTGAIRAAADMNAVAFTWDRNDEIEAACGDG